MSPFSLRSLLLAVIVLSNCITWAASRHHYPHNASGHRSRHRRQGANLFLSGSYVVPGGEGAGWGDWGELSSCSRTCGGGVASQKRICLQLGPDGQPQCPGGDTKYISCQTQDCPPGSKDYRAEQCSEFDDVTFRSNIKYNWVPYTNSPFPCELNCMPHGERFYYRHRTKVADGTRCNDESFDVCVNGTCQPVGCDMMLGSSAREDKCRECRGNGANCQTISGLLDTQEIKNGYNDMLLIPKGATTIVIEEVAPSQNYLALRAENNTYYLNGYYHIDFPRTLVIAGALWTYERHQQGFAAPDKLRCLGPTTEPLYLALLLQKTNVGIKYEYSIPNALAPPKNKLYDWVHDEFTPCSTSCGGGIQIRNVTCRLREELEVVDDKLCDKGMKPPTNQTCNTDRCPAQWSLSPWGRCSKRCGKGGVMSRDVTCTQIIANGYPSNVDEKKCLDRLGEKPEEFQKCNENAMCPVWFTGPWKPCNKLCDQGKQKRRVVCYQKIAGRIEMFDDSECEDKKPAEEQPCMLAPCDGVDWMLSEWSGCDTCVSKHRFRTAKCATASKVVVDDKFCAHHEVPVVQEECKTKLPECEAQWYATQWSKCSVECGKGEQTREVFCGLYNGESVQKVNDSDCAGQPRYNDTKECDVPKEKCPFEWFASHWSNCSEKCDGGVQFRRVMCVRSGETAASADLCSNKTKPSTRQDCNQISCDEVLDICGPDEIYEEAGLESTDDNSTMMSDSPYDINGTTWTSSFAEHESTPTLDSEELMVATNTTVTDIMNVTEDTTDTSPTDWDNTTGEYENTTDFPGTTEEILENKTTKEPKSPEKGKTAMEPKLPLGEETTTASGVPLEAKTTDETNHTTATEPKLPLGEETTTASGVILEAKTTDKTNHTTATEPKLPLGGETTTISGLTLETNTTEETTSISTITDVTEETNTTDETTSALNVTEVTEETNTTDETTIASSVTDVTEDTNTTDETTITSSVTDVTEDTNTTDETTITSSVTDVTEETNTTDETARASNVTEVTEETNTTDETTITSSITDVTEETDTTDETARASNVTEVTEETNTTDETTITLSVTDVTEETDTTDEITSASTVTDVTEETNTTVEITSASTVTDVTEETNTTDETTITSSVTDVTEETNTTAEITSASTVTDVTEETNTTDETTITSSVAEITADNNTTEEATTTGKQTTATEPKLPIGEETTMTESGLTLETNTTEEITSTTTITEVTEDNNSTEETTITTTIIDFTKETNTTDEISSISAITEATGETNTTDETTVTSSVTDVTEETNTTDKITSASTVTEATGETNTTDETTITSSVTDDTEETNTTDEITSASNVTEATGETNTTDETTITSSVTDVTEETDVSEEANTTDEITSASNVTEATGETNTTDETTITSSGTDVTEESNTTDETTSAWTVTDVSSTGSEFTTSSEGAESTTGSEATTSSEGLTRWDLSTTVKDFTEKGIRICRQLPCNETKFGCCPDLIKPALGTFDLGCDLVNSTCDRTTYGCCPDGLSPAKGRDFEGCPIEPCEETLFGCCQSDNMTAAEGNDQEGCPPPPPACLASKYGCCKDGETEPTGPEKEGCPEITTTILTTTEIETTETESEIPVTSETSVSSEAFTTTSPTLAIQGCGVSEHGCCYDNVTAAAGPDRQGCPCEATEFGCCLDSVGTAQGPDYEGCVKTCNSSIYGCCSDGKTPAHGVDFEGCCLLHPFGCCPDNIKPASGPHFEGCECQRSRFGCCPDNVTIASGPGNQGCGCQYTEYGCCPDGHSEASAADFNGCSCHTYQFGCCPDGVTAAQGPGGHGCYCQQTTFGCCGDEQTHAKGPNQEGCDCATSKYGCCLDGTTEATGPKFQGCPEKPKNKQAECNLKIDHGPCKNFSVYWFYDTEYGGCSRFWYGGCEGNGNRFSSKEDCEDTCVSPPPKDACKLPQIKGACHGYNVRWYYDNEHDACSSFVYGGCLGNDNNFETRELCQAQCEPEQATDQCSLVLEAGPCSGNYSRWGYNKETRSCVEFVWGGCEGNSNRFSTEAACRLRCNPPGKPQPECSELQDAGNCTDTDALWAFSQTENRCVPFYHSGCGGNENKFRFREDCEEACPSAYVPELCTLPASIGGCSDYSEKWYFDTKYQRCRMFYYGGCGGNGNQFNSERECENRCSPASTTTTTITTVAPTTPITTTVAPSVGSAVPTSSTSRPGSQVSVPDLCALPSAVGDCSEYIEKWFFDSTNQRCRPFYYGGCGGNENKFDTERDCESRCSPAIPTTTAATTAAPTPQLPADLSEMCFLRIDAGPCDEFKERWAYDTAKGKCITFQFGGCGGNQNNFPTENHCSHFCRPVQDICQLPMLSGPCDGSVMQWFYDAASDSCSQFAYGGCEGNENRFNSREECESRCKTGPAPALTTLTTTVKTPTDRPKEEHLDQCTVPHELEPCSPEAAEVWYYDEEAGACVSHQNQETGVACRSTGTFYSQEACERACGGFRDIDVCGYPLEEGPCSSYVPKYYYNKESRRCKEFAYGGCLGGPNRFSTIQECQDICLQTVDPCTLPPESGNCLGHFLMWFYDENNDRCDQFAYGGCGGNENKFDSRELCEGRCKKPLEVTTTTTTTPAPVPITREPELLEECRTPSSLEPCGANVYVYYYDEATSTCKSAGIGGCGYRNTYKSVEQCERRCGSFKGTDVCQARLDPGPCRASISKFYFDTASGNCIEYAYGGCQGGPNRFSTAEECQEVCGGSGPGLACLQAVATGRSCGVPAERRWHYEVARADCIPFAYQGCDGNANNFRSYAECAGLCHVAPSYPDTIASRRCEQYAEECSILETRCKFSVKKSPAPEGCERCFCEEPVNCEPQRQYCDALKCSYGVEKTTAENGCEICKCYEDPCTRNNCAFNERCVAAAYRDSTTHEVLYEAYCEPENITNEVTKDCDVYAKECEQTCRYGLNRVKDSYGCERCQCQPDPCGIKLCADGERCVTTPFPDPVTRDLRYTAHCRAVNKEGECPASWAPADSPCRTLCNDDADCRGVLKCCARGCSRVCVEPAPPTPRTTPSTTLPTTPPPEIPQAPQISTETEPQVEASEGGKATLRCIFHGNPPPKITWRFGEITIDSDVDRYRLLSDGALEIVSLYRNDSGVYICVGTNELGAAEQQITLQVGDPVSEPAAIAGSPGATVTGELGRPLTVRCLAYGYPEPAIYWYRGNSGPMVPYSNALYEARSYDLRIHYLTPEALGEYECQAYNGVGPAVTWAVTVLAYQPDNDNSVNQYYVPREVAVTPRPQTTHRTSLAPPKIPEPPQLPPEPPTPSYPEARQPPQVSTETKPQVEASEGGKATLRCIFHGNPPPKITWRFGEIMIDSDVDRYRLLSDGALEIVSLYRNDSGVYICVGTNELGTAEQQVTLQVGDPVTEPAAIAGSPGATVTGELGRPLTLRCPAYGYPEPSIYWYLGNNGAMVPYSNELYEARSYELRIHYLTPEVLGEYECQAYNGVGPAVTWAVTVLAYQPDNDYSGNRYYVPREVAVTPRVVTTHSTSLAPQLYPEPVPVPRVPVSTRLLPPTAAVTVGAQLSLPCEVTGVPNPEVHFTKDGATLLPNDRIWITGTRLTIQRAEVADSGEYGCHASNAYSSHSSTAGITVQDLYIPAKCVDSPIFANCALIVESRFCGHKYYSRFCCRSCVVAGQLNPRDAEMQADEPFRKK